LLFISLLEDKQRHLKTSSNSVFIKKKIEEERGEKRKHRKNEGTAALSC
jgi:ribosomal protein L11